MTTTIPSEQISTSPCAVEKILLLLPLLFRLRCRRRRRRRRHRRRPRLEKHL